MKDEFRRLVKMPRLGHPREEIADEAARVTHVSGILVIYDPTLKPLTILRVVHAARESLGRRPSAVGGDVLADRSIKCRSGRGHLI